MSTSLLYHGFGIRGYRHVSTGFEGGKVIFTVRQDTEDLRCSHCHDLVGNFKCRHGEGTFGKDLDSDC